MRQGKDIIITLATGTPEQKAMVQDAINRWWPPTLMMFGPPDTDSKHTAILRKWGIKTKTNDELRRQFVSQMVPELHALGIDVPGVWYDEEAGSWLHGKIDWDEFWQVIRGNGPMNAERLGARRKAHKDGQWVREALQAYAEKHGDVL